MAAVARRLSVGVGDDEIDPGEAGRDHVVDGVAARSADTDDGQLGLQIREIKTLSRVAHIAPVQRGEGVRCAAPRQFLPRTTPLPPGERLAPLN